MGLLPRTRGRQDPSRRALAGRGLVVLTLAAALIGLAYARTTGAVGGDPRVEAVVADAGGSLRPGSDVKISGVIVGRVEELDRAPGGGVRVSMTMPEERLASVPANVVARILPATVFGTSFVDLVVYDGPSPEALAAGDTIPADRTQDTLELQRALDDIDRLTTALGPAELSAALGSAAQALEGRGAQLGRTVDLADRYVSRLVPELPLLRSDLVKLATNLEVVDRVAPDLLTATDDALVTLRTVLTQRASVSALISGGTSLARSSRAFLDANQRQLVRALDNAALLLDALYDNRRVAITGSTRTNIALGEELPGAVREGFVRTDGVIRLDAPPYYTRADRPRYGAAGPGDSARGPAAVRRSAALQQAALQQTGLAALVRAATGARR